MAAFRALWTGEAASQELTSATNWSSADSSLYTTGIVGTATFLIFPAMAASSAKDIAGGNYSSAGTQIVMASFNVEPGCALNFGTRTSPLRFYQVDSTIRVNFAGRGHANFGLNSATEVNITNAAGSSTSSQFGVNIQGFAGVGTETAITSTWIDAGAGTVGLGGFAGNIGEFTNVVCRSGSVTIGSGVSVDNIVQDGGIIHFYPVEPDAPPVNVTLNDGVFYWYHRAAPGGTMNMTSGIWYVNATTTFSVINLYGGTIDFSQDGTAKTWATACTSFNWYGGSIHDPGGVLTWSTAMTIYKGGTVSIT